MKRVYLAGPLFSAAEKAFNAEIATILENAGYSVFLPQRDGVLASELEEKSEEDIVSTVFAKDSAELEASDVLVFVLDGRVPDEGACVELGLAYAKGKRCYGIRTDARALENGLTVNPMIVGCLTKVFSHPDADRLFDLLRDYLAKWEL